MEKLDEEVPSFIPICIAETLKKMSKEERN